MKPTIQIVYVFRKGPWRIEIIDGIKVKGYVLKEAWLVHDDYGIKDFMYGIPVEDASLTDFVDMIMFNLDECIDIYKDLYFDKEDEE